MRALLLAMTCSAWCLAAPVEEALQLGPVLGQAVKGRVLYLALESGGIAVVDVSGAEPRLVSRLAEGRVFERLFIVGDSLVALELREEARTFSVADPLKPTVARLGAAVPTPVVVAPVTPPEGEATPPPPMVAAVPSAPAPGKVAKVTSVTEGRVLFDGGPEAGFVKAARVRVISQRLEKKPDLVTGKSVDVPSGAMTAVLEIEEAQDGRAMAVLGRGDYAEVGDLVELTTLPVSERLFAPRRAPFEFRTGFVVRPFLGLEGTTKPVGLLIDGYVHWYLPTVPIALSLSGAPLGVALNTAEAHYPGVLAATVSYATDFFEIGLGAGALYGNPGPCFTAPLAAASCEQNTGFTINQVLRLGALDGFHFEWHSSIFSRTDRFVFGVGRGVIGIPLSSRLGLYGGGGAGENGWLLGEFGVRTYLGGAGGRGTLVLSASLGASAIFDGPSREYASGPAVSFGMEWRL